jgi:ubiquinone/menaquinone biosynthesis C-methylase UbiE
MSVSEFQRNKPKPKPRGSRPGYSTKPPGSGGKAGSSYNKGAKSAYGKSSFGGAKNTYGKSSPEGTKNTYGKSNPGGAKNTYGKSSPGGAKNTYGKSSPGGAKNAYGKSSPGGAKNTYGKSSPGNFKSTGVVRSSRRPSATDSDHPQNRFPKAAYGGKRSPSPAGRSERAKNQPYEYKDQEQRQPRNPRGTGERPRNARSFQSSPSDGAKRPYRSSRPSDSKGFDRNVPREGRSRQGASVTDQTKPTGYQRPVSQHRPTDEIMQEYIEQLIKARSEERVRIARKMATHERDAISAVNRLLSSRDHYLRLAAAMVLSYVKSTQAIPALVHALGDPEATVRLQAAAGLGQHRNSTAREALWYAFPDKSPGVSIAILRSMENVMTDEMADALQVMDTRKLSPRVQAEIQKILGRRTSNKQAVQTSQTTSVAHVEGKSPLSTAPWLRMLAGAGCTGFAIAGTEEIAAALLQWRLDNVTIERIDQGAIRFNISRQMLPQLVEARAFDSIWVNLPRVSHTELTVDTELFNSIYAFAHAKGLQSVIIGGECSGSSAREFARALELRSTRPPGNPRTLRLHVSPGEVSVEFIANTDFPLLRSSADSAVARALVACLCALTVSGPTDVLLDPFCGEGNVLIERALLGPMGKAIGADHQAETVERARRAWHIMEPLSPHAGDAALFTTWNDQLKLDLETNSVDTVATTLSSEALGNVLPAHLNEIERVLKPNRRAAFLVADNQQLRQLLTLSGWTVRQETAVGEPQVGYLVVASKE